MNNCVFCQIVAGRAPSNSVYGGEFSVGIVPLNPVTIGHVIFLPRIHVTGAVSEPLVAGRTMRDAAAWVKRHATRDALYRSVNIITSVGEPATQTVFHLHIHVVPRRIGDGLKLPWSP